MLSEKDFAALKKNLKKSFEGLKKIRVALLGDSATQLLVQCLKGVGFERNIDLDIWEADFNQVERQIFDASSEFYVFKPELVIIFKSSHKLLSKYNKTGNDKLHEFANNELALIDSLVTQINKQIDTKILFYNYTEINDSVFGNYATKINSSYLFQLRKLNYQLMEYAIDQSNFYIIDLSALQNESGKSVMFNTSVYINTEMVLSLEILPRVSDLTADLIASLMGAFKKCVILDLDNTLWGGIIGDDGLEHIQIGALGIGKAFTEFQQWLQKLKNRGIILAVCSKNTEWIAKEPFEKHPEMILKLDDIALFVANWESKIDNISYIQRVLNIGLDSMVFLDDNPYERNVVREKLSALTIPELPEDPANYLEYLYGLNLFETTTFSEADKNRTKQYQLEAERVVVQRQFTNEDDFLKSLDMISLVEDFNTFNTPRVAQLSQRSNQYNLRTIRYTEADITNLKQSPGFYNLSFTLKDKFGDNGLICIVVLKKENAQVLFIENWLMSCRVLKRGMENFVLNTLVVAARQQGCDYLKGEYIPTSKNEMVQNHYLNLGFKQDENYWLLNTSEYEHRKSFIKKL